MYPRIGIGIPTFRSTGGGAPPAPSLLLDDYPDAAAAYSLRQLRTAYTGPAITLKVLDGGANPEHQIFFDGSGELDTTQIQQLCGPFEGVVAQWYDQSGNNRHASQTNILSMPKIYQVVEGSGSVILYNGKPAFDFDGTNDAFIASSINLSQPDTFFTVAKRDIANVGKKNLFDGLTSRQEGAISNVTFVNALFAGSVLSGSAATTNQELQMALFNGASSAIYINGSLDASGDAGGNAITSLGIGRDNDASDHFDGKYQELILYPSNQSTNRTGIETNINTYYGIY